MGAMVRRRNLPVPKIAFSVPKNYASEEAEYKKCNPLIVILLCGIHQHPKAIRYSAANASISSRRQAAR